MRLRPTTLALLAATSVLTVAACNGPDGKTDAVTTAALVEKAQSLGTFRFTAEVDHPEPTEDTTPEGILFDTKPPEDARIEGQTDLDGGYSWFSAPGLDGPAVILTAGDAQALLRSELVPEPNRPATAWVSFDGIGPMLRHLPDELVDGSVALGTTPEDPTGLIGQLRQLGGELEQAGTAKVRGVATTRYRIVLDAEEYRRNLIEQFDEAMTSAPADDDTDGFSPEEFRKSLSKMQPPRVSVWVDSKDRLRRMKTSAGGGAESLLDMRLDLYDFGAAMDILRPADDQITSADTLELPPPTDDGDPAFPDGAEPADFPEPVRSSLSIRPVLEDRAGRCADVGDPHYEGKGSEDADRCYRLGPPALDRPMLLRAHAGNDSREWYVTLQLAPADAGAFDRVAADNLGRQLALVVDDRVMSAPTIQTTGFEGAIVISGNFTQAEAEDLVSRIVG